MKILHYTLGMPPYRTGGLTKYSYDLMIEEMNQNQEVYLLFPGKMSFTKGKTNIKKYKNYKGIQIYELINPLPVPLLKGICNPSEYMEKCDKAVYINFIKKLDIELVHIHTFMGLHKEMLEVCKELQVKVVYTTHDYFGLCTRVNFIDYNGKLCKDRDINKCIVCNSTGNSINKIKVLQSGTYRFIKNNFDIQKLKKISLIKSNLKTNKHKVNLDKNIEEKHLDKEQFQQLIDYYKSMFEYIDKFLFNSNISKEVYGRYLKVQGEIFPITHSNIHDNRKEKKFSNDKLNITYLGPNKEYKGFNILYEVMLELQKEDYSIVLNAYGDENTNFKLPENIKINGRYSYSNLADIFHKTDFLIVPSIWKETFGFITLEALSYGIPVITSDTVGSKDLLIKNNYIKGIVIKPDKNLLKYKIKEIYNNRNILKELNFNILNDKFNYELKDHCNNLIEYFLELSASR